MNECVSGFVIEACSSDDDDFAMSRSITVKETKRLGDEGAPVIVQITIKERDIFLSEMEIEALIDCLNALVKRHNWLAPEDGNG